MRTLLFATMMALAPVSIAAAQSRALVIVNDDYDRLGPLEDVGEIGVEIDAMRGGGGDVEFVEDATRPAIVDAIARLAGEGDQTRMAILVGRFASAGGQSYFLGRDAEAETLVSGLASGVPVSAIAEIVADAPNGVLILAPATRQNLADEPVPEGMRREIVAPGRVTETMASLVTPRFASGSDVREREVWAAARAADAIAGYRTYLAAYPEGAFRDAADARIAALESPSAEDVTSLELDAERRRTIQSDLTALGYDTRGIDGIFGSGTRAALADWREANGIDPASDLDGDQLDRLAAQAEGRRASEEEAERTYWQETGQGDSVDGLTRFLARYPAGRYGEEARTRLAELQRATTAEAEATEREEQVWRAVRQANSAEAYRQFLAAFPDGPNADAARSALDGLTSREEPDPAIRTNDAELGLSERNRRAAEERLSSLGLDPGPVDGTFDAATRDALRSYQDSVGLPGTGYVDQETALRLLSDAVRELLR